MRKEQRSRRILCLPPLLSFAGVVVFLLRKKKVA